MHLPGSSPVSSAFPTLMSGRLPASFRERDFSRGKFSRLQLFRYVQASELACLPDRSYRCRFPRRAAEAFTSEQNVRRYLRTHRICVPPDYRQLAARGLSPREIHSIVDCSISDFSLNGGFNTRNMPSLQTTDQAGRSTLCLSPADSPQPPMDTSGKPTAIP